MRQFLLTLALLGGVASAQTAPAPTPTPAPAPTAPASPTPAAPAPASPAPAAAPATPAADPATLVGQVGAEKVTLGEFERAFRLAAARVVNSQGVPFEDSFLAEFASARPEFLKQFLRDRAIYQLARVNNAVDSAELDKQLEAARADFKTDEEFQDALNGTGYADGADLRSELERQAVVGKFLAGIQGRFKFGDALVASYYSLNRPKFTREAEACVKHILVPQQADAQAIVKQLDGGADFAKLAAEKSQDPGSGPQGGDLGCFGKGQMVESFDKASFTGPLNKVQTVQSQFGWHVLLVSKRTDAGTAPLTEAAPLIREQLGREAAQKYLNTQIAKLNTQSFPETVTVAPAAAPAPGSK